MCLLYAKDCTHGTMATGPELHSLVKDSKTVRLVGDNAVGDTFVICPELERPVLELEGHLVPFPISRSAEIGLPESWSGD